MTSGTRTQPKDAEADLIESLARECNRPIDEVRAVYEAERDRLRSQARITDYLVLFASRRTAEVLRSR
jgi:hypothetical protein